MKGLTPRQAQTLRVIEIYIQGHGYAPSIRDLESLLGIRSTNAVAEILAALERKGHIRCAYATARSIRVLKPPPAAATPSPDVSRLALNEMAYRLRDWTRGRAEQIPAAWIRLLLETPIESLAQAMVERQIGYAEDQVLAAGLELLANPVGP